MKRIFMMLACFAFLATAYTPAEAAGFANINLGTLADDTGPTPIIVPAIPINTNPVCIASGGFTYQDCLVQLQKICSKHYNTVCPGAYCVFGNPAQIVTIPCPAPPAQQ